MDTQNKVDTEKKMYTLFIQKQKKDPAPFPLTGVLNLFLSHSQAKGVYVSPGHLSKDPVKINTLLGDLLTGTAVKKFGIGNVYGRNSITEYENYLRGVSKLWRIDRNGKSDHKKMVFIFDYKGNDPPDINQGNYTRILDEIDVIGVAIGSSNFSYQTYGPLHDPLSANKGEADIFMFYDKDFIRLLMEQDRPNQWQNAVLSESLTTVSANFLNQMLAETLKNALE